MYFVLIEIGSGLNIHIFLFSMSVWSIFVFVHVGDQIIPLLSRRFKIFWALEGNRINLTLVQTPPCEICDLCFNLPAESRFTKDIFYLQAKLDHIHSFDFGQSHESWRMWFENRVLLECSVWWWSWWKEILKERFILELCQFRDGWEGKVSKWNQDVMALEVGAWWQNPRVRVLLCIARGHQGDFSRI